MSRNPEHETVQPDPTLPHNEVSTSVFSNPDGSISANDIHLRMDYSKLPRLPELPSQYADAPFLHRSYVAEQKPSGRASDTESLSLGALTNERDELLGDTALNHYVTLWLVTNYRHLDSGAVHLIKYRLIANANLGRLARHYKLHERLKVGSQHRNGSRALPEDSKVWADTLEAYIGAVCRAMHHGHLPLNTLYKYFAALLSSGVYIDMQEIIEYFGSAKQRHAEQRGAKKRKKGE